MRTAIVVPCFDESSRLDRSAFERFVQTNDSIDFILVNDGSRDTTLSLLSSLAQHAPDRISVIDLPVNVGKAEAVRQGVQRAFTTGADFIGYWDADLATPLEVIPSFVSILAAQATTDLVIGARVALLGRHITRKAARHYLGRVFATAASLTLNLPVYDTQCGAKLFRNTPRMQSVFSRPFASRWNFDVEIIARYLHEGGASNGIYEEPVPRWTDTGDSKVRPLDFVRAIGEMAHLYQAYPLGQPLRPLVSALTSVFSRYAFMGAVGTLLHYATLVTLVEVLRATPTFGAVVGASVGALANYVLNYHLTFASQRAHQRTFPRFVVVALLGVAISGYGVKAATTLGVSYLLAQVACTIVVLGVGYVLNRLWTFAA